MQIAGDIFSISEDLRNIVHSNIKNQAYYIQKLLVDKLDNCKGKGKGYIEKHIKEIQDAYQQEDIEMKEPETKGKQ